jgi:hypothetical protein
MAHIKRREDKKSTHITPPEYRTYFFDKAFTDKPCFCFQYIHPKYNSSSCEDRQIRDLVERLERLSTLTWADITSTQRHGFGSENIERKSFKVEIPPNIPKEATLLALRFSGKNPMVGFREKNIFHIVFLDSKFTVYDHG